MQEATQYKPCPICGSTSAQKVRYTWWGGALGPSMFTHVKCNNCAAQFNGRTGKSNKTNILIYFAASMILAFCVCSGFAFLSYFINR